MAQNEKTQNVSNLGVSIWLDDLSRERINQGSLQDLIATKNVVGVTTNPAIFGKAIMTKADYNAPIEELAKTGADAIEVVKELTTKDVADACEIFTDVYNNSGFSDGRVSIEVDPRLAHDGAGTITQAEELYKKVNKPNVMIKIPAIDESIPAITETLAKGISVNVTLIFTKEQYLKVIEAYILGIQKAKENGHDLNKIHSVASFFVSRVDTAIDAKLDAIGTPEA
ncbi:MAG: transaldolase, partial [Bifidobacteriaceae bacterium]|nr:transaldolase [Bifidobacteriaceae bacterium]